MSDLVLMVMSGRPRVGKSSTRMGWHRLAIRACWSWLDEALTAAPVTPDAFAAAFHLRGFLALLQADPIAARRAFARAQSEAR